MRILANKTRCVGVTEGGILVSGEWGREGPMVMGPSCEALPVWREVPWAPGFLATSGLKGGRVGTSGSRQELAASLSAWAQGAEETGS